MTDWTADRWTDGKLVETVVTAPSTTSVGGATEGLRCRTRPGEFSMSTRKLILVSLLLGVVILVAFAVQLVLASQQAG